MHVNTAGRGKNEGAQEREGGEDISLSGWRTNESPERDAKRRNEGVRGEGEVKHTKLRGMAVGQTASALGSLRLR